MQRLTLSNKSRWGIVLFRDLAKIKKGKSSRRKETKKIISWNYINKFFHINQRYREFGTLLVFGAGEINQCLISKKNIKFLFEKNNYFPLKFVINIYLWSNIFLK